MPESHHPSAVVADADSDPLIGQEIEGRFRLVAPLGQGGMGRVYRAVQGGLDREVAVKILNTPPFGERDLTAVKRFFLEASVTARLAHPNIVVIYDHGRTEDGILYIAMEYLRGRTLAQILAAEGRLAPARVVRIGAQIARAVREAHRNGLVHRDLKPSNVMILQREDEPDFVKVLDFGLAKFFAASGLDTTLSGGYVGSPLYMAPEMVRGEPVTPRTDVYSLGAILYEAACGRPPFQADSPIAVLLEHASSPPPRPRMLAPEISPALEQVILRAMEKDPARRFASMGEMLEALLRADDGAATAGEGAPLFTAADLEAIRETGSGRWSKLLPWLLLAAAVAAAAAAALAGS